MELNGSLGEVAALSITSTVQPSALATPGQVAEFLGGDFSEKTLANWRSQGKGPKYRKIGRHVRYRWPDVQAWVDAQDSDAEGAA